jgi:hypothetical protein
MNIGDLVEYQVDLCSWGIGRVVAYDEETEVVTVRDEDDGTTWHGLADHALLVEDE